MSPRAVRRTKPGPPSRINWLRWLALLLGGLVFLGHVITLKEWVFYPYWLSINWPDVYKHFTTLAVFALAYRLSFGLYTPYAGRATVAVCSTWGALCEITQHWIPPRDFSVWELAVNILAPIAVAGVVALFTRRA